MTVAAKSVFETPLIHSTLTKGIFLDQGWHGHRDMAWSRDRDASVGVMADNFPDPVVLEMTFRIFNASAETPKTLFIESLGHDPIEFVVTTQALCTVVVETPVHQPGARYSPIHLRLDSLDSPAKLGLSSDERLLGLNIHSLSPKTTVLSTPLDFTDPETCEMVLREGWSPPEPETGAWSVENHARLVLPGYLFLDDDVELVFEASALPRPEDMEDLKVEVRSGGTLLANWHMKTGQDQKSWPCPLPKGGKYIDREITLIIHGVASPMALGINQDSRNLGVLLREINFKPTVTA